MSQVLVDEAVDGHYAEDSIDMGLPPLDEIDEEAPPPNSVSVENAMGSLLGSLGLHSAPSGVLAGDSDDYDVSLPPHGLKSSPTLSPTEKAYSAMRRMGSLGSKMGHRAVDAVDANVIVRRGLHAVSGGKHAHLQQLSDVQEDEAEDARR